MWRPVPSRPLSLRISIREGGEEGGGLRERERDFAGRGPGQGVVWWGGGYAVEHSILHSALTKVGSNLSPKIAISTCRMPMDGQGRGSGYTYCTYPCRAI